MRSVGPSAVPRHVLFVAPSAYRLGGLATWLDYLLPGLEGLGWRATLGLVAGPKHHRPEAYLAEHPWHDAVAIECATGTERGRRNAVRRTVQRLQPDVVCAVNIPDAISAVAELRTEGLSEARVLMACHALQADLFRDMERLHSSLDAVACPNRLACELSREALGDPAVNVDYAPGGTVLPNCTRRRPNAAPFAIACVGRMKEDEKRTSDIVPIVRGLAKAGIDYRLLVAGSGPDEQPIRRALEACCGPNLLQWLGQLPAGELPDRVYRHADALLLTSSAETGPLVAWEAMAHGVVVVASRYVGSGLEGTLRHRFNSLLFDIGAVDDAVAALAELSADRELWAELSSAGRRTVASDYTIERSVEQWETALAYVVDRPARQLSPPAFGPPRGRLARWMGPEWAERIRAVWRRPPPDGGPGGEWPHTLSGARSDAAFWAHAAALDRQADATTAAAGRATAQGTLSGVNHR